MLAAALYAALDFFILSPNRTETGGVENKSADLIGLMSKVAEELNKEGLSKAESYILQRAQTEWPADPFLGKKPAVAAEQTKGVRAKAEDFIYSGYIGLGAKRLAIINGLEYETDEKLVTGEFAVRRIDPDRVILEGKQGKLIIPFNDEAF